MLRKFFSILAFASVLLSVSSTSTQSRPRETKRVEILDQESIDDHLQSLFEIRTLEERASRLARQQRDRLTMQVHLDKPLVHKPPPPALSRNEKVVQFALSQVGKPYVWAADGPGSYDCSGLVMTAFSRIGVKLPHFTGTMIRYGKFVSRNQLVRGDIVFPTSGHVGIYLGNGMFVHASSSRAQVSVTKLYSFYAGRRI